jgi:hypothetical protein
VRVIQRVSAWIGWAALLAAGLLLILEATGTIGGEWRTALSRALRWVAAPSLPAWAAALLGALVGLVALAVLIAQFVPVRTSRRVTVTERTSTGTTAVSAVVVRRAAVQRLREVDGITDAAALADGRRLSMRARLAPDTDAQEVSQQARAALGEAFWADLGVPVRPIDLTLVYA